MAEDAWNSRDPDRVVQVYAENTIWRNRAEFPVGRKQVHEFLQRKWAKELEYRLIKELWAATGNRIAVRLPMSGMIMPATGSAVTATRIGSLTNSD